MIALICVNFLGVNNLREFIYLRVNNFKEIYLLDVTNINIAV